MSGQSVTHHSQADIQMKLRQSYEKGMAPVLEETSPMQALRAKADKVDYRQLWDDKVDQLNREFKAKNPHSCSSDIDKEF